MEARGRVAKPAGGEAGGSHRVRRKKTRGKRKRRGTTTVWHAVTGPSLTAGCKIGANAEARFVGTARGPTHVLGVVCAEAVGSENGAVGAGKSARRKGDGAWQTCWAAIGRRTMGGSIENRSTLGPPHIPLNRDSTIQVPDMEEQGAGKWGCMVQTKRQSRLRLLSERLLWGLIGWTMVGWVILGCGSTAWADVAVCLKRRKHRDGQTYRNKIRRYVRKVGRKVRRLWRLQRKKKIDWGGWATGRRGGGRSK